MPPAAGCGQGNARAVHHPRVIRANWRAARPSHTPPSRRPGCRRRACTGSCPAVGRIGRHRAFRTLTRCLAAGAKPVSDCASWVVIIVAPLLATDVPLAIYELAIAVSPRWRAAVGPMHQSTAQHKRYPAEVGARGPAAPSFGTGVPLRFSRSSQAADDAVRDCYPHRRGGLRPPRRPADCALHGRREWRCWHCHGRQGAPTRRAGVGPLRTALAGRSRAADLLCRGTTDA